MATIHVRLADVPTDVLVTLVDHSYLTTADGIAAAVAPPETPGRDHKVRHALALLRELGLVEASHDKRLDITWRATDEGRAMVHAAREAPASPDVAHAERGPWPTFDDRPWCITHTQREPCDICASYIAAGL